MSKRDEGEIALAVDDVVEQVILASAFVDAEARAKLVRSIASPDAFLVAEHRAAWAAVIEMDRRKLDFDVPTFRRVAGDRVRDGYLAEIIALRPRAPNNLDFFIRALQWDRQKAQAAAGPLNDLLASLQNPSEAPERVRALARHVAEALGGPIGAGRFLHDPKELVASQMREIEQRANGVALYPYGIPGLDTYEPGAKDKSGRDVGGRPRMIPGAMPGLITLVAGSSGSGKSTLAARLSLTLSKQKRKGMYCAWEPKGGMTLELLACISLGWSRSALILGRDQRDFDQPMPREQRVVIEERMHLISKWVVFMANPFRGAVRGRPPSNYDNLDILREHVAAAGVDWVICDLWERLLEEDRPGDERRALQHQQSMAQEMNVHFILVAQQRKDVEQRADKRPTREGISGSGMWFQVADTILAPYRPALWKNIADDKLELYVLKQRWGAWPLAIEFDWDPDMGAISGGRSVSYDPVGEGGALGGTDDLGFRAPGDLDGDKRRQRRGR